MNDVLRALHRQIRNIVEPMDRVATYPDHRLNALKQRWEALTTLMTSKDIPANRQTGPTSPDWAREIVAGVRQELNHSLKAMDEMLTTQAEAYRRSLGEEKEAFEQLDNAARQARYPAAYSLWIDYHLLKHIRELIRNLNGTLLEASGRLEENRLDRTEHFEPREASHQPDNDPAKSPLSP